MSICVRIAERPFDPEAECGSFRASHPEAGAFASFTGQVRGAGGVQSLRLEHYPEFTEHEIRRVAEIAARRFDLCGLHVVHRVGEMMPGDSIVLACAAAIHRRAAFEAADFIMDYLKSEAPLWKSESAGGRTRWIEPRAEDLRDLARWKT